MRFEIWIFLINAKLEMGKLAWIPAFAEMTMRVRKAKKEWITKENMSDKEIAQSVKLCLIEEYLFLVRSFAERENPSVNFKKVPLF